MDGSSSLGKIEAGLRDDEAAIAHYFRKLYGMYHADDQPL